MALTLVSRCPKGEVRWTPLSGSRTPRVHGGGKNDFHMAEKVTKNDRRAKIVGRPTHKSLPFTTMQAELKSDKPTPSHTHPHPLMGVGFGDARNRSQTTRRPPLYTVQVFCSKTTCVTKKISNTCVVKLQHNF